MYTKKKIKIFSSAKQNKICSVSNENFLCIQPGAILQKFEGAEPHTTITSSTTTTTTTTTNNFEVHL